MCCKWSYVFIALNHQNENLSVDPYIYIGLQFGYHFHWLYPTPKDATLSAGTVSNEMLDMFCLSYFDFLWFQLTCSPYDCI